ncbi:hypothetical protein AXG93_1163s1000 [Marchantia polymorpha subsp. ruderalis]|uniref:Uncharacterized protein n=1 Tax=Marchantia polymorpha subsp. ruderalis TaxID=1480154 RepID=A0A176VY37_MARPO|nr:hypothetical protein AXG93_1163s1000 [Marchantia polymorpha subsp. ruderalis]
MPMPEKRGEQQGKFALFSVGHFSANHRQPVVAERDWAPPVSIDRKGGMAQGGGLPVAAGGEGGETGERDEVDGGAQGVEERGEKEPETVHSPLERASERRAERSSSLVADSVSPTLSLCLPLGRNSGKLLHLLKQQQQQARQGNRPRHLLAFSSHSVVALSSSVLLLVDRELQCSLARLRAREWQTEARTEGKEGEMGRERNGRTERPLDPCHFVLRLIRPTTDSAE